MDRDEECINASVLIVDDDDSIRETVQELLASDGISALTASNAGQCLAYLKAGFRGVILMDVMMPEMDGWSTIREIQQAGLAEGNIISMLTSLDSPDEQMDGLQELVVDYIVKPIEPDQLLNAVRHYLSIVEQIPGRR